MQIFLAFLYTGIDNALSHILVENNTYSKYVLILLKKSLKIMFTFDITFKTYIHDYYSIRSS